MLINNFKEIKIMKKYVYEVPAILPIDNFSLGGYGFTVYLDSGLAIKARSTEIKDSVYDHLKEDGIKLVRLYLDKKYNKMPYQFAEDSWLLHAICVPGDACDLALGQFSLEDFLGDGWKRMKDSNTELFVDYAPHNVDTLKQALCLRELFINWANTANNCLNYD